MTDLDLKRLIGAALMVRPTDNWHYPLSENQLRHLITQAVEAERERMKSEGWRQCAERQKTTQFCGMLEQAVTAEREACAKACDGLWTASEAAEAIRARGESK